MVETHLAVAKSLDDIPHTKKGNPVPGKFPYKAVHNPPTTAVTYTIPLKDIGAKPGDTVYIAAHAVVMKTVWKEPYRETMYLSDTGQTGNDSKGANIYRYSVDDFAKRVLLDFITHLPAPVFDQIDALAATPDGKYIYAIDRYSHHIAKIDPRTGKWKDLGKVTNLANGVVLAAFSPSGELWVASQDTNHLYVINLRRMKAKDMGGVTYLGKPFNFQGADIVFTASGTLYAWSNYDSKAQPRGMYIIDVATMTATYIGTPHGPNYVTGMAIRHGGLGPIMTSAHISHTKNKVFSMTVGGPAATFIEYTPYYYGYYYGLPKEFKLGYGDMTVGALAKPICSKQETAWAKGEPFSHCHCGCGCHGNWAMYFTYTIPTTNN
ncbi:hypothetical protein PYJP_17030 [Pyrofollis japonicus]|nr:hypothetical protein PYJP_17030 [Pyrofollis japonicus]